MQKTSKEVKDLNGPENGYEGKGAFSEGSGKRKGGAGYTLGRVNQISKGPARPRRKRNSPVTKAWGRSQLKIGRAMLEGADNKHSKKSVVEINSLDSERQKSPLR